MKSATWALTALLLLPALPVLAQIDPTETGAAAVPPKQAKLFTLNLKDAPIRQALENLFANAGAQYTIEDEVTGFVTLKIADQPLETALKLLLRTAHPPLTYTKEGDIYRISARTDVGTPNPAGQNTLITINLRDAPLRSALEQVFKVARQQFVISPEVNGKVTMMIDNQPLPQALTLMVQASGDPITWRLKQGVYHVEPTNLQSRQPTVTREPGVPLDSQAVSIPVRNMPAAELLRQLNSIRPEGIDNILVKPGTNSLVAFAATQELIDTLRKRVQLLDLASDSVVLKAEIIRIDERNVRTVLFSTVVQGQSGSPSTVNDKANGAAAVGSDIRILLTPTMLDGRVEVTSTWDLSLPLAGMKGGIVRLEKSVSTKTQLQPGKLTLVGETKRNQNGLKDQIQLYLSAELGAPTGSENSGVTRVPL